MGETITPLDVALALASRGYHVFPARVTVNDAGKKTVQPLVAWTMASTTLPGMIREWWGRREKNWRTAHVCIDTGRSGIVVVDCDVRHGDGPHTWRQMAEVGAVLTTTSGGEHHLYRADPDRPVRNDQEGTLAPSVDVRGEGGMVIVHPAGYAAALTLPAPDLLPDVPSVVRERVGTAPDRHTRTPEVPVENDLFDVAPREERRFTPDQAMDRIVRPALLELQRVARENRGGVNGALNAAACALSHFVPDFWSADEAMGWLTKALGPVPAGGTPQPLERFRRIVDGTEPIRDDWKAVRITPGSQLDHTLTSNDALSDHTSDHAAAVEAEYQRLLVRREASERLRAEDMAATADDDAVAALMARMLDSAGLDEIEDLPPLIEGWLSRDSVASLIGASESFKSFVALDMACHVATKRPWWGAITHGGPVVYVIAEGARGFRRRLRAWEYAHNDGRQVSDLHFLPEPVQVTGPEWNAFIGVVRILGARMVILDTQARCTVGVPENDNTEMGRVFDLADKLRRETEACVLFIHHTGYDKSHARGATAMYAGHQTEITVDRPSKDSKRITISTSKQKDDDHRSGNWKLVECLESLVMANLDASDAEERQSPEDQVATVLSATVAESMTIREQVARVLHGYADGLPDGITKPELISALNDARRRAELSTFERSPRKGQSPVQTVHRALRDMERDGHLRRPSSTRYGLSEAGCAVHGLSYTDPAKNSGE